MTAHPDDLLRRADVVAWLRARLDEADGRVESMGVLDAYRSAGDDIEAGAVPAATLRLADGDVAIGVAVPRGPLPAPAPGPDAWDVRARWSSWDPVLDGMDKAIAAAREMACAIADDIDEGHACIVCGAEKHAPDCIVPGWSHRRADGSVR